MLYIRHIFSVYLSLFWFGRATGLTRQRISTARGWEPTINFSRSRGAEQASRATSTKRPRGAQQVEALL